MHASITSLRGDFCRGAILFREGENLDIASAIIATCEKSPPGDFYDARGDSSKGEA